MTAEVAESLLKIFLVNYPNINFTDGKKEDITALWLMTFENVPDDLMLTAGNLVIQKSKYWPTVAEIRDAIKELYTPIKVDKPKQPVIDMDKSSDRIKYLLDAVHDGRAKEYIQTFEIEPEVMNTAKSYFPEISEATVRKNYPEVYTLMEYQNMCKGCFGRDACPTGGCYLVPRMTKTGWIKNDWRRCDK